MDDNPTYHSQPQPETRTRQSTNRAKHGQVSPSPLNFRVARQLAGAMLVDFPKADIEARGLTVFDNSPFIREVISDARGLPSNASSPTGDRRRGR
jgi:hypothetical protein